MTTHDPTDLSAPAALPADTLRWHCDPDSLPFESTAELEPIIGIRAQDDAVESLRFGLEVVAPGQNIFVRGLPGTGRMTAVKELLEDIRPQAPLSPDHCYVHNFAQPDRPRLLTLPRGLGLAFRVQIDELAAFIRKDLGPALKSDSVQGRRKVMEKRADAEISELGQPFDAELRDAGLGLTMVQMGPVPQPVIVPLVNGEPATPDVIEQMRTDGQMSDQRLEELQELIETFSEKLKEVSEKLRQVKHTWMERVRQMYEDEARMLLTREANQVLSRFEQPQVRGFVEDLVADAVKRVQMGDEAGDFTRRYRVNVIQAHEPDDPCPIIVENVPTMSTLLGSVDVEFGPDERPDVSHMGIRAGSLLEADGGYLVLEARDVASDLIAWRALVRVLRAGQLDIIPPELEGPWTKPALKPDPIPITVKVILLGDGGMYELLDAGDPDFGQLFKVLADFETQVDRDERALSLYGGVLSRLARDRELPPFHRTAVARMMEHGARIAARRGKVSLRFGRIYDIAHEAAFLARKDERSLMVMGDHVTEAVRRTKARADMPARRLRELVVDGTMRIRTEGRTVGQVNGLAVSHSGPLSYGFPARITATIGPGSAGAINIERESALSGAIHTKGFYILGGLLRFLLRTDHPLAFSASVAFEQSYGGIDGDSASGAEICCLLSALTDVPLRQDLAMTGAIDQVGNVLPIGAANEKIEGFFDVCSDLGLIGTQGVIIPGSNAGDLMLRSDVVQACAEGRFAVYAVDTIQQALELFTGMPAGAMTGDGGYAEGTLLGLARRRARAFWDQAQGRPNRRVQA